MTTLEDLKRRGTGFLPGYMGVVVTGLADQELRAELTIQRHHIAPNGFLHAGTVVTLADTACGYGCVARAQHLGRTTQLWDAVVSHADSGKTIALFRCTQLVLYAKT